jgi:hypothetical protein
MQAVVRYGVFNSSDYLVHAAVVSDRVSGQSRWRAAVNADEVLREVLASNPEVCDEWSRDRKRGGFLADKRPSFTAVTGPETYCTVKSTPAL